MPAELPRNRLGFAQWLLRPEHPLTARVTVNRFWQEVFGTGLVKTTEDFGVNGEMPVASGIARLAGGRVPRVGLGREAALPPDGHLGRLSAVGRGHAREARTRSAEPLALARPAVPHGRRDGPRLCPGGQRPAGGEDRRAERQAVSARRRVGGGGHVGSNTRDYQRDSGENLYRRSMYTFWKRAAPPASMESSTPPRREVCTVRRERTNTPLQALVTLNDPQFVEAARHLAETTLKEGGDNDREPPRLHRPAAAGPAACGRRRCRSCEGSLDDLLKHYQADPDEAKKLLDGRRVDGRPEARSAHAGRLDDADQRIDEPGRSVEQVDAQLESRACDRSDDRIRRLRSDCEIATRQFLRPRRECRSARRALAVARRPAPLGAAAGAGRPQADRAAPLGPHFPGKAKHVIYLHMVGGPSQMDLYDYKPKMDDWYDKDLPDSIRKGQRLTTMTAARRGSPSRRRNTSSPSTARAACGSASCCRRRPRWSTTCASSAA